MESGGALGVPGKHEDEQLGPIEERFRDVRQEAAGKADIVELERETRESIDPDLPYKRTYDPAFGYFKDRMGIDPHDVSFYYELSTRPRGTDERAEPFRQHFTNFHDLREALERNKGNDALAVELVLPPEFLKRLEQGGDLRAFADGFGIVRREVETNPMAISDRYAEAVASGELARLKEENAHGRHAAADVQSMEDQQQALRTELGVHDAVGRVNEAVAEKELTPEERERMLRAELTDKRKLYVDSERWATEFTKKHRGFWSRRKLERTMKRAELGAVLAPGDKIVLERASSTKEQRQEAENRKNVFFTRLREQGVEDGEDVKQAYELEQHKIDYEYARTELALHLQKIEVGRFVGGNGDAEHAREQARAKVYDELFVQESLTLNRMKLAEWPGAEKGKIRTLWEEYRNWYGKRTKSQKIAIGAAVGVGIAGAGAYFGAMSAGAAALYAGRRVIGTAAGVLGGYKAGELADTYETRALQAEIDRLDARERKLKDDMRDVETIDPDTAVKALMKLSQEYQGIMDARYAIAKRRAIVKAAATAVSGFALGYGASSVAHHAAGLDLSWMKSGGMEHAPIGPKPSIGAMTEATPAPKSSVLEAPEVRPTSEPVHASEVVPSPERAAETPLHEVRALHPEQPPLSAQLDELATVKKGEGAWGPVRRQLRAQLTAHPEQFGLKPEDLQNGAKVQHALNSRTTQILKDLGFIGPKGTTQLGIHPPGTKIILESNGGLRIEGGNAYDYGAYPRAADVAESHHAQGGAVPEVQAKHAAVPENNIHHEPLRPVPEPPSAAKVPVEQGVEIVPETPISTPVKQSSFLADALAPSEAHHSSVAEVAATAQETSALRSTIVQEVTAHYADRYNELSPLGKECFVHGVERHVELSGGKMSPAEVLREPDMFRQDFELAKTVGAVSPQELSALTELGFTKEDLFTVSLRGDYGYAATIRDMRVADFVKNLTVEGGGIDGGKLEKVVNFFLPGNRGSAILIGDRHLKLAEKLARFMANGGRSDVIVAEALIAP
ncbi:MAG: hypothetical protein RL681_644 [Candidatus Parcubacteria bacterium]|jgi:hypothetical protein